MLKNPQKQAIAKKLQKQKAQEKQLREAPVIKAFDNLHEIVRRDLEKGIKIQVVLREQGKLIIELGNICDELFSEQFGDDAKRRDYYETVKHMCKQKDSDLLSQIYIDIVEKLKRTNDIVFQAGTLFYLLPILRKAYEEG